MTNDNSTWMLLRSDSCSGHAEMRKLRRMRRMCGAASAIQRERLGVCVEEGEPES